MNQIRRHAAGVCAIGALFAAALAIPGAQALDKPGTVTVTGVASRHTHVDVGTRGKSVGDVDQYASLIYNGYWWSPERRMLQQMIDASQASVNGAVRLKLYKGNVIVVGRESQSDSLFDTSIATFEDDRGAYNQKDAEGFIRLNALRMRIAAKLKHR